MGVPPDINAFHRYTRNSTNLCIPQVLQYAKQFPGGPKSDEALYDATYRQGVLVSMYMVDENKKKADAAAERTKSLAAQMHTDYPNSDFTARAASIAPLTSPV